MTDYNILEFNYIYNNTAYEFRNSLFYFYISNDKGVGIVEFFVYSRSNRIIKHFLKERSIKFYSL